MSSAQLFCLRLSSHSNSAQPFLIVDVKSKVKEPSVTAWFVFYYFLLVFFSLIIISYITLLIPVMYSDGKEEEMEVVRNIKQWKYVGQVTAPLRKTEPLRNATLSATPPETSMRFFHFPSNPPTAFW